MFIRITSIAVLALIIVVMGGCNRSENVMQKERELDEKIAAAENKSAVEPANKEAWNSEIILRFLEIGSDGCVPCKMMRPVMERVSENYDNVRVLFYEVNSDTGRAIAQKYNVRLIPTQIFLDNDDNVIKRHEGFYAFEDMSMFIDSFIGEN